MSELRCSECGRDVGEDFEYCPECGTELSFEECPACGSPLPDDADGCGSCDAALEDCPECGELIVEDSDSCKHCGARFVTRGVEVDDVTEAVRALDDEAQSYLTEAVRRDPALIEAWAQLVGIAPDPTTASEDDPEYEGAIRSVLDDRESEMSAQEVTDELYEAYVSGREHPITEHPEVPDDPDVEWVRSRLEALVDRGAIGRRETDDGVQYRGSIGAVLDEEMSLTGDKTLEDIDRVVAQTGMDRAIVLRKNMNAQFTDLIAE